MAPRVPLGPLAVLTVIIVIAVIMTRIPSPPEVAETAPPPDGVGEEPPNTPGTQPPGTTPTPQSSPTRPGGFTGGLVVRGAELVQPWISIEYKNLRENSGYQVLLTVKLDKVFALAPRFWGDANSLVEDEGKGPWAPLGFYDETRNVLYVLENPLYYAQALLEGRAEELESMFQALVIPGDLRLKDARLLPPAEWGAQGAPGLLALTEEGALALLPPPGEAEDVVDTGKSSISRVVFLGEPMVIAADVEGLATGWTEGESGVMAAAYWRGDELEVVVFKRGFLKEAQVKGEVEALWEERVEGLGGLLWASVVEASEDRVLLIAGTGDGVYSLEVTPQSRPAVQRILDEQGRAGTLLEDAVILLADAGVYLFSVEEKALTPLRLQGPEDKAPLLVSYSGGVLTAVWGEAASYYSVQGQAPVLNAFVELGLRGEASIRWAAGGLVPGEGVEESVRRAHGVEGVRGPLYGSVVVGVDRAFIVATLFSGE